MSPFILILPLYWVFQMIVLLFVALFSAITGDYYAAVPRDGGDTGRIVYEEISTVGEPAGLRVEFPDGDSFAASRASLRVVAAGESLLLDAEATRIAVLRAELHNSGGERMDCEFGWPPAAEGLDGACRGSGGRWFDVARRDDGSGSSGRDG